MVRLTPELIQKAPQFTNCLKQRELDLRGQKIPAVENLGATLDQFDSIDLTDNEIRKLDNFPILQRLEMLLLSNNRIAKVSEEIGSQLPNLHTLNLAGNNFQNLADLDPLATLTGLTSLSLIENNVTKQPQYRLYLINFVPQLKYLDYKKIKTKERNEAKLAFAGVKKPTFSILKHATSAEDTEMGEAEEKKPGLTEAQIRAIQTAIANAQTLEEVARLEKQLKEGQIPST